MRKFEDTAVDQRGNVLAGVSVRVRIASTATDATIYSDDGTATTTNPLTTDANGLFSFYVEDGRYDLVFTGSTITTRTISDMEIGDLREAGPTVYISGDTTTDFGAKVNAAVANLPATGGTIVCEQSPGTWTTKITLSKPCVLRLGKRTFTWTGSDPGTASGAIDITSDDVTIEGAGWDAIVTQGNAANCQTMLYSGTKKRINYQNFKLDGNDVNQTNAAGFYTGIRNAGGATDICISRCFITRGGDRSVDIRGTNRVFIMQNFFKDCGLGVAGVAANGGNATSVDVDGTTISSDVWICYNTFESWGDSGPAVPRCSRAHVIGNIMRGYSAFSGTPFSSEAGIDCTGSSDTVIANNVIEEVSGPVIAMGAISTAGVDYKPSNNRIEHNCLKATNANLAAQDPRVNISGAGLDFQLKNIDVVGNSFIGVRLAIGSVDRFTVVGNAFHNVRSSIASGICIEISEEATPTTKNFVVGDNVFTTDNSSMTTAISVAAGVTTPGEALIVNNTFESTITNTVSYQAAATAFKVFEGKTNELRAKQHSTNSTPATVVLRKSRGTSDAPTTIANNDLMGQVSVYGYDGTNFLNAGTMTWFAHSSGVVTGTIPTRFSISAMNAAGSLARVLLVDQNGDCFVDNDLFPIINNSFLGSDSARWQTYCTGLYTDVETKTAGTYTNGIADHTYLCDCTSGTVNVGLTTAASSSGRHVTIKKIDSSANTVVIDPNAAETLEGAATYTLRRQYESVSFISDGTNWHLVYPTPLKRVIGSGNPLVAGDFALSAGWGATAAVSAVTGSDMGWQITVTANGAGIAANPTITLTFKDGTWTNAPICITKMVSGTGTVTDLTEVPTATTNVITFNGTPGAGSTYIIASIAMGR